MSIRLIALDLAGTLEDPRRLSKRDREALRTANERGIHIALFSAGPATKVREFGREIGVPGPVVAERGGHVLGPNDEELACIRIPPDIARAVIAEAPDHVFVFMKVGAIVYARSTPRKDWELSVAPPPSVEMVDALEAHLGDGPWWIVAHGGVAAMVKVVARLEVDLRVALPGTVAEFALFTPRGGSREDALRRIRQHLGVEKAETFAIVDAEEAIPMFRQAGFRFARQSADERVRLAAGWAAEEGTRDDVAEMLRRHVFDAGG